jgi:hypothetical protein
VTFGRFRRVFDRQNVTGNEPAGCSSLAQEQ